MLQSMGSQGVGHNLATEQQQQRGMAPDPSASVLFLGKKGKQKKQAAAFPPVFSLPCERHSCSIDADPYPWGLRPGISASERRSAINSPGTHNNQVSPWEGKHPSAGSHDGRQQAWGCWRSVNTVSLATMTSCQFSTVLTTDPLNDREQEEERSLRNTSWWASWAGGEELWNPESGREKGFPGSSAGRESAWDAGDPCLSPGSGRSTGEGIGYPLQYSWASLVAQLVKNLPAIWETWVQSLGWEDPLEKGKATHPSNLA